MLAASSLFSNDAGMSQCASCGSIVLFSKLAKCICAAAAAAAAAGAAAAAAAGAAAAVAAALSSATRCSERKYLKWRAVAQIELRLEALHLAEHFRDEKRHALLHLLSDAAAGITFFLMLALMREGRASLFSTIGRIFGGLSDTAKAFLIIASMSPARDMACTDSASEHACCTSMPEGYDQLC